MEKVAEWVVFFMNWGGAFTQFVTYAGIVIVLWCQGFIFRKGLQTKNTILGSIFLLILPVIVVTVIFYLIYHINTEGDFYESLLFLIPCALGYGGIIPIPGLDDILG